MNQFILSSHLCEDFDKNKRNKTKKEMDLSQSRSFMQISRFFFRFIFGLGSSQTGIRFFVIRSIKKSNQDRKKKNGEEVE